MEVPNELKVVVLLGSGNLLQETRTIGGGIRPGPAEACKRNVGSLFYE